MLRGLVFHETWEKWRVKDTPRIKYRISIRPETVEGGTKSRTRDGRWKYRIQIPFFSDFLTDREQTAQYITYVCTRTEHPPSTQGTAFPYRIPAGLIQSYCTRSCTGRDYQQGFFAHQMYQNPVHFHVEKKRTKIQTDRQTDRQTDTLIAC